MATLSTGAKVEKLSFAKVAAAGLKPPSNPQTSNRTDQTKKQENIPSSPDDIKPVSPSIHSNQQTFSPKEKKVVAVAPVIIGKEAVPGDQSKPEVLVHAVRPVLPGATTPRALDGMLLPTAADEIGTQASSSDSVKLPSLEGKSVNSGTTFALDEKESLRPDDSASVIARDEEDSFPGHDVSKPVPRIGSDDDMRAFHDQLREISIMDSGRLPIHPQDYSRNVTGAHGMLYTPPQGLGVGNVPGASRHLSESDQGMSLPPDPKLIEALESPKDRIMVLKLEQDIVDFVKDAKEMSLNLPQTNTFYRMLAHKLADYYMLGHDVDESSMAVRIFKTSSCRLPPPLTGIATPSTAASTPPPSGPQMKILRRGVDNAGPTIANGSNVTSQATSENGDCAYEDDKKGKSFTREEREARYEAARKRIMGSAKPAESGDEPIEMQTSRSSSATGKRNSKKKRTNSDDDFDARSAYCAYYAVPQTTPGASMSSPYAYSNGSTLGNHFSATPYGPHGTTQGYLPYGGQTGNGWIHPSVYAQQGPQNWQQPQQPHYDASADFQRNMSLQQPPASNPNMSAQSFYHAHYSQQSNVPPQPWQQQSPYMQTYPTQTAAGNAYHVQPPPAPNHVHEAQQPYAFGQLPSHVFPGRPPSNLEHPLPGSYKSKHFDPRSQAFVPGYANGSYPTQPPPSNPHTPYGARLGMANPPHRQDSTPSQHAMFCSPQQPFASPSAQSRVLNQPMMHPLPQPVFPQQPSPNVPLPPKPGLTPPKLENKHNNGPAIVSSGAPPPLPQSTIAKWDTASLPAKPPLPESFIQNQRQTPGSGRAAAALPSFGSILPANAGLGINGQSGHPSPRR